MTLFLHPQLGRIEILLVEDWLIFVADSQGFVWQFQTELWAEWVNYVNGTGSTRLMLPFMRNHSASRVAKLRYAFPCADTFVDQCTRGEWDIYNATFRK